MTPTRWSELVLEAQRAEARAIELWAEANRTRCRADGSGGARCTADADDWHTHRVSDADRPDYTGDEVS